MHFADPLIPARLVRRYKRFLADAVLADGGTVTAHCPNPGSMMGLAAAGAEIWLAPARKPGRKLRYTLEIVRAPDSGGLVGVNTGRANALVAEALAAGRIGELAGYASLRREVRYGTRSRVDFLLEDGGRPPCYLEVKNVTLKRDAPVPGTAEFPDAVTARGTRHLGELAAMAGAGARAVLLYLAQRDDCDRFAVAADIDPAYAEAVRAATAAGVETLCYACDLSPERIELARALRIAC